MPEEDRRVAVVRRPPAVRVVLVLRRLRLLSVTRNSPEVMARQVRLPMVAQAVARLEMQIMVALLSARLRAQVATTTTRAALLRVMAAGQALREKQQVAREEEENFSLVMAVLADKLLSSSPTTVSSPARLPTRAGRRMPSAAPSPGLRSAMPGAPRTLSGAH
jgi:hypothetical protein